MEENQHVLPLGIMKQAVMKLDSAISDLHECCEDDDISPDDKDFFRACVEVAGDLEARLVNIASREIDEETFLRETIDMDHIDPYPGEETVDIMDDSIE